MELLWNMIVTLARLVSPFVFVFSLVYTQKFLTEKSLHYVWCGLLAGFSLLILLFGLPSIPVN